VNDGVDAIMLAGETAVGLAPARVVRTLHAIITDAELATTTGLASGVTCLDDVVAEGSSAALCEAAVTLAEHGHAEAIVAVTRTGRTARLLSAFRPDPPVYAITGDAVAARRLAAVWGIVPVVGDIGDGIVPAVPLARQLADRGMLAAGSHVVIVSVDPDLSRSDTNFLKLQRL
jgi:pyruvate kinase